RRLARLEPAYRALVGLLADQEAVQPGDAGRHRRMVQRVADQVEGDERIHPGWLDAAPAAVRLLPGEDPVGGATDGPPAPRGDRTPGVPGQDLVETLGCTPP